MKKILSMVLSLCMVMSLFSGVTLTANAATYTTPPTLTESQVITKINDLVTKLDGKYFTTTQTTCGDSSCSECNCINVSQSTWFINMFGSVSAANQFATHYGAGNSNGVGTDYEYFYINSYSCAAFVAFAQWYIFSSNTTDAVSTSRVVNYDVDGAQFTYEWLSKYAKPGDVIRIHPHGSSKGAGHSVVFISCDENGVEVLDSNFRYNGDSYNRVRKHTIPYTGTYNIYGVTWGSCDIGITRANNYDVDSSDNSDTSSDTSSDTTTPSTKTQYRYGRWVPQGYESSWWHFCPELGAYYAEKENRAWAGQPWILNYYNQSVNDGWIDTKYEPTTTQSGFCDDLSHDHTLNGKTYYTVKNGNHYWDKYTVGGTSYYWREERTVCVVHDYSNDCDTTCNRSGCGATRTVLGHKYDNTCDTTCNTCGATRTITHTYANDCDTSCNVCGKTRTTTHKYDNACDTTCNTCGATRTITHTYTNTCDTSCNVCGATRTITHTYDNSTDSTCNVCGTTRNISVTGVTLNKTTASLNVGETVTLTATVSPSTATNKNVTWSSSNTTVATVSNGVVTAKAAGIATITVKTADGSKTATCTVTVTNPILASGECGKDGDNITWILKDTGELIISGSGEMADYSNQMYVPWYSNRLNIKTITLQGNITSIGDAAFAGLVNVKTISVPSTVAKIGNYAFNGMTGITSIALGENIQSVGNNAFDGCTNLSSVTLHDNISKIGSYAFQDCTSLETIDLPTSLTAISNYTFYGCKKLTNINIPDSVKTIGDGAFEFCTSLTKITLPDNVTVLNRYVFQGCTNLSEITYSDSLTSIGAYAFKDCTAITKINLPKTVTEIESGAFNGCTNLSDVYYGGTSADKSGINIGSLNNSYLINATWHYAESETAPDENVPQIVVESKTVVAGDQVEVTVSLKNNPGIAGLAVSLKYDETVLTLDSATKGTLFSGFTTGKNYAWDESENVTDNGILATFTFTVSESATAGDYTIEVIPRSCTNENLDDVELEVTNGKITVIDFVYGDANGDQEIDMKDVVILRKYITNYDYDTETSTVEVGLGADANGDQKIDMKDVVILRKYITNYDYDTESSTVVLGPQ